MRQRKEAQATLHPTALGLSEQASPPRDIEEPLEQGYELPKKNKLASASVITGIISMVLPFAGIASILLGAVALFQIKAHPERGVGSQDAVVGIVLGVLTTIMSMFFLRALAPDIFR